MSTVECQSSSSEYNLQVAFPEPMQAKACTLNYRRHADVRRWTLDIGLVVKPAADRGVFDDDCL
jgi:hypothetical protein